MGQFFLTGSRLKREGGEYLGFEGQEEDDVKC